MAKKTKPEASAWGACLLMFDRKYFEVYMFDAPHCMPKNLDDAAGHVSTWLNDNLKAKNFRKAMRELPEDLWIAALKKWRDGEYDT